jgi:hypothetical protein
VRAKPAGSNRRASFLRGGAAQVCGPRPFVYTPPHTPAGNGARQEARKEAATVQRTSLWLVIRVLGLILVAVVVLFKLATPRITVSPGEEIVAPSPISQDVEPARKAQEAGLLADGADQQKAEGVPAAAGMGQAPHGDAPARAD